jgi:hypothetical protein
LTAAARDDQSYRNSRTSEKAGDGYVHCEIIHALSRPASCQQIVEAELAQRAKRGRNMAVGKLRMSLNGRYFVNIGFRGEVLDGGVGAGGDIENVSQAL